MQLALDKDKGFILTLHEKAGAADLRTRAELIDWLANEGTHILLRAGRRNDRGATCFTTPCMVRGDPTVYSITVFFL